ncbi:MAG TPA: tetratricopeptide repeat protein, partial [Chthonomonadaceae bacterium]|nr:tetratricopeptide repeat protein [Chthonomonadaceae bacterium]
GPAEEQRAEAADHAARLRNGTDLIGLAHALNSLADIERDNLPVAISLLEESLATGRQAANDDMVHLTLAYLAGTYTSHWMFDRSRPLLKQCLAHTLRHDRPWHAAKIRLALGEIACLQGRLTEALSHVEPALIIYRELEDRVHTHRATLLRSDILAMQGDAKGAVNALKELERHPNALGEEVLLLTRQTHRVFVALRSADTAHAESLLQETLPRAVQLEDESLLLRLRTAKICLELCLNRNAAAFDDSRHLLELEHKLDDAPRIAEAASLHALSGMRIDKRSEAIAALQESTSSALQIGLCPVLFRNLIVSARVALVSELPHSARACLALAKALQHQMRLTPWPFEQVEQERLYTALIGRSGSLWPTEAPPTSPESIVATLRFLNEV